MIGWFQILAVVVSVAVAFEILTFYGPLENDFTRVRYRTVAGHDHVAPRLEIALTLLLALAVWFIAVVLFPDEGRRFLDDRLWTPWLVIAIGFVAVGSWLQVFWASPREARELLELPLRPSMLRRVLRRRVSKPLESDPEGRWARFAAWLHAEPQPRGVFDTLHPETQALLKDLHGGNDLEGMVRQERWNGIFYWVVGTTNFGLALLIGWLSYLGLSADFAVARASRSLMRAAAPTVVEPFDAVYRQLETYYASFRDFEIDLLETAKDLTGVLAIVFIVSFLLFGTLTYTIYSKSGQFWSRVAVSVAVFVLFPTLILVSYFSLLGANQEVTATLESVTATVDLNALDNDQLAAFHDVEDRLRGHVDLPGFGSRLATSSGGFLLILGTILSLVQDRTSSTSFLRSIVPRRLWRIYRRHGSGTMEKWGLILTPADDLGDYRLVRAMRYAAVAIVGADGTWDPDEIDYAVEWINSKSLEPYRRVDFDRDRQELSAANLEAAFARVARQLEMEEKERLVVACIDLAAADGNIDSTELARIEEASLALGLSPAHFRHLTSTHELLSIQAASGGHE